jgi:glycosyltransferase involved in cell wall biosynthesis
MRILVIAPDLPFPPVGGGQLRTYHLLKTLAERHEITLAGFVWGRDLPLADFPVRLVGVPWEWPELYKQMKSGEGLAWLRAFDTLSDEASDPWFVSCYESAAMTAALRRLGSEGFDLVLIEHSMMARFIPALPDRVPKILDLIDVHSHIARRAVEDAPEPEIEGRRREAARTLRFETDAAHRCDLCLAVSEREAAAARKLLGVDGIQVIPNGVDTVFFTPSADDTLEGYLLFTGLMNYSPNVEAVQFFCSETLPMIVRRSPHTTFHIVGSNPTEEVYGLGSGGVVIHGSVPDTRPYFREAETVVVPLLRGGGTRLKILEAAACGKPVVTTSLGVEGLHFRPGDDLLVADNATEFAESVLSLSADEDLRRRLGRNARSVAVGYDWRIIGDRLGRIVDGLLQGV